MARSGDVRMRSPITLHVLSPSGPALSHHVGVIVRNVFYVHGGVNKYMSKEPLNSIYRLDLGSPAPVWTEIRTPGSPSLSHHACVLLEERYIVLVGGWTGRVRSTDLTAYDVQEDCWFDLKTSGFPEKGGLSSHAAAALDDGGILVVGREGSARLQRRFGNAWILRGSIKSRTFAYHEHDLTLASRSGHTMHAIGSTLAIIGGRMDTHVELHQTSRSPATTNPIMKQLSDYVKISPAMHRQPCGRKQHASVSAHGVILLHGGETFDGKSRVPVSDFYLITLKPAVEWRHLGRSDVARAGHIVCISGDSIVLHGGLGAHNVVHSDTYTIQLSKG